MFGRYAFLVSASSPSLLGGFPQFRQEKYCKSILKYHTAASIDILYINKSSSQYICYISWETVITQNNHTTNSIPR
jgi:hypothetical protein